MRRHDGYSLVELIVVTALIATMTAVAMPRLLATVDDDRTAGGVRYVAAVLQHARMQAVLRHADVAVRIVQSGASYTFAEYVDGNGNGVSSRDISSGADWAIRRDEQLPNQFSGVDFGTIAGLPAVDSSSSPPGTDPIRLGSGSMATFSAAGTSSSGSLYVKGRRNAQYVIRIYGETGRTRILRFDPGTGQWKPF
jgi:prepilin-type N-terminal cleavage/methylation domain-containing protein